MLSNIFRIIKKIFYKLINFKNNLDKKFFNLYFNTKVNFYTFLNFIIIIIAIIMLLVGFNPVRLYLAATTFPIPIQENREKVNIYLPTTQNNNQLIPILKQILFLKDPLLYVKSLAQNISNPNQETGNQKINLNTFIELPPIDLSITRVWILENQKTLIINLNETIINYELKNFLESNTKKLHDKSFYLDTFFRALTASIFSSYKNINLILYRIDGKKKKIPDMSFDLSKDLNSELFLQSIKF